MSGLSITVSGNFGATGWATGAALARQQFVEGASRAFVLDALYPGTLFQDREGLVPVTALGQPVRRINDRSGQGRHAILRADATGIPSWQGAGDARWVQIPLASGFHIANPLSLVDWTAVGAVQIDAASAGTSFPVISQYGAAGNHFIPIQISRIYNGFGVNLNNSGGHELAGEVFPVATPVRFTGIKDVAADLISGTASIKLNSGTPVTFTGALSPPNGSAEQPTTELFCSTGNGVSTAGRLYYMAFVSEVREATAIEAIAAQRLVA